MDTLPSSSVFICMGFFFLITVAVGAGLLVYSARTRKKSGESQAWPYTTGTITVSEVRESTSLDDDGGSSTTYTPRIEYAYEVAGQAYTGKRVGFGGVMGRNSPAQAQASISQYPLNKPVQVFYNPAKPSEAVLERALGGAYKATRIIGIIFLVISLVSVCAMIVAAISA